MAIKGRIVFIQVKDYSFEIIARVDSFKNNGHMDTCENVKTNMCEPHMS